MNIKRLISGVLLAIWISTSSADVTLKPFQENSLQQITDDRKNQPFLLLLWSIDCPPCLKELAQLQQLHNQFSASSLVLVSTDDVQIADSVEKTIKDFQLEKLDNWIFSESIPERLRYAIDPAWYGELPRAYFYDASHQRKPHSGSLNTVTLNKWLNKTRDYLSSETFSNPALNVVKK